MIGGLFLKSHKSRFSSELTVSNNANLNNNNDESRGISLKKSMYTGQFWLLSASYFCFGFSILTIYGHFVPHVTDIKFSAAVGASLLATLNGVSIVGRSVIGGLGDRIGNKQLFTICLILLAIMIFSLVYIQQLWILYIFAIIFGIAAGAGVTQQSPLVARVFGMRSHGLILGVVSLNHTIGGALGVFLAGYIFDITGNYDLIFIICAILAVGGFFIARPVKSVQETNKLINLVHSPERIEPHQIEK